MAEIPVAKGTKFYNIKTGRQFTAGGVQDIGGGQTGQFIRSESFSLTPIANPTAKTSAFSNIADADPNIPGTQFADVPGIRALPVPQSGGTQQVVPDTQDNVASFQERFLPDDFTSDVIGGKLLARKGQQVRNKQTGEIITIIEGQAIGTTAQGDISGQSFDPNLFEIVSGGQATPTPQEQASQFVDPATGEPSPAGVGVPESVFGGGERILNEEDLQTKREELGTAGIAEGDFGKFISSPDEQGNLFFNRPATLTSPTGEKKVVASGSAEASQLLAAGWTLGDQVGTQNITSPLLTEQADINIGETQVPGTFEADAGLASAKEEIKAVDIEIKRIIDLITPPETDLSRQVDELLTDIGESAEGLTGRGAAQLSEEEKRGLESQRDALADKNTELKKKIAEVDALTASFNLANVQEEGRPQTLSRLQGAQSRNFRMFIAQKNLLTSEAGFIQAELLGMQGKLAQSQAAADRAVNLLYMDREFAFNAKIAQLNILQPQLEKEEARYAAAVQLHLQRQADSVAEQKQQTKTLMNIKLDAINAGITDPGVLASIGNARSVDEALQILGTNIPQGVDIPSVAEQLRAEEAGFDIVDGQIVPQRRTGKVVTDASGASYDIGTYATDPNHEASVQRILDSMGQMTSVGQIDNYIQSVASGSPVTGQMILSASEQFGVSSETMMAIMQQDSNFGTLGAGARSFNPGNVGNTETATSTGQLVNFGNWQSGVNAVARNLAGRAVSGAATVDSEVQGLVDLVNQGRLTSNQAFDEVSDKNQQALISALAESPVEQKDKLQGIIAQEKSQQALSLKTHKGFDPSVGINFLGRIAVPGNIGAKQEFIAGVQQLVSGLSLEALIEAKSRGATFGALSDTEMQILASAATRIGTWVIRDKNGKVKGYKVGHDAMRRELDNISATLLRGQESSRQTTPDGLVWEVQPDGNLLLIE